MRIQHCPWFAWDRKLPSSGYHELMAFVGHGRDEDLLIEARWHGSLSCPFCGSGRLSDRRRPAGAKWSTWRCNGCRRRFSVTSGTAIHSTKLSPSDWSAVASLRELSPASIAESVGVSRVTAHKIAALLQPVESRPRAGRLRHLLGSRREHRTAKDPWQIDPLPATLRAEDSPLPFLSRGAKATMNALRARPLGATAAKIAELAGISYSQTLRCLARLERNGCVNRAKTTVQRGYELRPATVWSLSWSDRCMNVLAFLRDVPTRRIPEPDDRIPHRFWRNFWSGASADTLSISDNGLHIAETLIGGHDVCARAWAISSLPTDVLVECRTLRGLDSGRLAEQIENEIARRAAAA